MFSLYARAGCVASMLCIWPAAGERIDLAELHATNGQPLLVNVPQIVSIREPSEVSRRQFAPRTQCVVVMSNAQFYAVLESCEVVRRLVEQSK